MNYKKHIDRLFQERLKEFEVVPNDAIWESIKLKLHEKKRKRRVIPLWWQMAGVAAILALLFTIGNSIFNDGLDNKTNNQPVVNTETKVDSSVPPPPSDSNIILNNFKDENVVTTEPNNETPSTSINGISVSKITNKSTSIAKTQNNSKNGDRIQKSNTEVNQALINPKNESKIASNTKVVDATNYVDQTKSDQGKINNSQKHKESEALIGNPENDIKSYVTNIDSKNENTRDASQNIKNAIAQVNNIDEKEESEKLSRWNISTNVAPVYFNIWGKGSSLDAQFVNNSKSGEINMSYGINGSFAFNKKLKIRAGINKVDLGYNTNNVIVYKGTGIASISSVSRGKNNINFIAGSESTVVLSAQNLSYSMVPNTLAVNTNSSLAQELGFIEVPFEIEYAILNKKIGVNIISGFSTFFLDKNNIYSNISGEKILIGEAQNINDTSYSANFGLGLNYNVSEKIKLNLEPMFKYQINTFQNTSGDFQPYFIGIYTGLSYKF